MRLFPATNKAPKTKTIAPSNPKICKTNKTFPVTSITPMNAADFKKNKKPRG
jgi:hypothetical protein